MPSVASTPATPMDGLMSAHLVVRPPSARITTRAPNPRARARSGSVKFSPSGAIAMPRARKSSSDGSPIRAPIRAARMAAISTTALTRRMPSRSIMHTSFRMTAAGRSGACRRTLAARSVVGHIAGDRGGERDDPTPVVLGAAHRTGRPGVPTAAAPESGDASDRSGGLDPAGRCRRGAGDDRPGRAPRPGRTPGRPPWYAGSSRWPTNCQVPTNAARTRMRGRAGHCEPS